MRIFFVVLFFFVFNLSIGQSTRQSYFFTEYQFYYSAKPIVEFHNDIYYGNFNGLNFGLVKSNEKGFSFFYGLGYSYYNGSSIKEYSDAFDYLYGYYFNYTRYNKITINTINVVFSIQSKPLNKKENIYLKFFIYPGVAFYKSMVEYKPEKIYLGLSNSVYKSPLLSLQCGFGVTHSLFKLKNNLFNLSYGATYHFIDLELGQIHSHIGVVIIFG